jgi:hypothetical protein
MGNIYVDLSQVATGTGVIGDPFNAAQFLADTTYLTGDTYLLKGYASLSSAPNITKNQDSAKVFHMAAWDVVAYGPWVLKNSGSIIIQPDSLSGGFLETQFASVNINCIGNVSNMVIKNGSSGTKNNVGTYLGCTFIGGTAGINGVTFYDCVMNSAYLQTPENALWYRCVFSAVDWGSGVRTDCQFGWTPPSWNTINNPPLDTEWDLSSAGLLSTVAIPPQPGTVPYTGYVTDMWNNARTGIGGGYTPTVPIPTGTRYIAEATAFGWTINNIYTYNGSTWDETVAVEGLTTYDKADNTTWQFDGTNWVIVLSDEPAQISGLTGKTLPVGSDLLVIEDSADSFKKKKLSIADLQVPYLERVFYPCHVITRDAYPPIIEDISFANNSGFTYPMMRLSSSQVREYFVALPMPLHWDKGVVDFDIYFAALDAPVDPAHQDVVIGAKIWADSLGNPINLDLGTFYSSTVAVTSQYNLCMASLTGVTPIVPSGNPLTYPGILWLKWFRDYSDVLDTFDGFDVWCPYVSFRWRIA